MQTLQILQLEFDEWANNQLFEYKSCCIQRGATGLRQRLVFGVLLNGQYKVMLGNRVLYAGNSFAKAKDAYNLRIEDQLDNMRKK